MSFTITLLVQAISNGGGSGFVDDSEHVETRDGSGILGSLSLVVVEIGGNGDDGVLYGLTDEGFGDLFHLNQDHGGDFFGIESLLFSLELDNDLGFVIGAGFDLEWPVLDVLLDDWVVELSSDESLGIENSVQWVLGGLVVGGITNKSFVVSEADVGWGSSVTLVVGDDFDSFVLPETDA